ncbi:MAG TPA: ABC transporter ATP-binding protein [Candidatus Limnocylindria bacterium]|nr:ABC transporter ATP-binding protein [Candidatus Limnocylindria bacterium]
MSNPFLVAKGLHKSYQLGKRRLEVLHDMNLIVPRGGFVALQGASGAGKSTLLHLIGGLDRPDRGTVQIDGTQLGDLNGTELSSFRNRHIGFIFQAFHLLPELDAIENVALPARMARTPKAAAEARAKELLSQVGLGDRMNHRPLELSGGEQQRVAVARSLVNSPALILADEPTGNLDSHTGQEIIQLLVALQREHHVTLAIATHDKQVADRADTVVRLADGRLCDTPAAH